MTLLKKRREEHKDYSYNEDGAISIEAIQRINLLNTDMNQQSLEMIAPDKTKPILSYCNGIRCLRSSDAVAKALDWGYKNIFWFRGGWNEWTEKRLPVISD